jgi:hypothetical protein
VLPINRDGRGGLAEWSNAPHSKRGWEKSLRGSNPLPSAEFPDHSRDPDSGRDESHLLRIKNMTNISNENLISIMLVVAAILIGWLIALQIQVLGLRKKIKIFLKGKKVKDVEEVILEQVRRMDGIEGEIKDINEWNKKLQGICDISITKVGVIRFNPFKDTGGDQSFAIALLDSNNNGIVLSSLYAREGTRVYTKPIEKGTSSYNLSEEEEGAIKKAISG